MVQPRRPVARRSWLAAGALAALLGAGCGASATTEVRVEPAEFEVRGPGDATALVPVVSAFQAGQAVGPGLEAFGAPDPAPGTAPAFVAANPTHEGFPLVVSVVEPSPDGDWLQVRFPQRPNGTTGWVRRADLQLWGLDNRIEVSVSQRTLRVLDGDTGAALFETSVSVGSDVTPTPLGDFFIDIVNPLGAHPTYGWGQLSVSGFSDVLQTFEGGVGQIAIHGWNRPADMGRNVSNGCVRMNNDDIAVVASLAPLGTPVTIVA
ncbi:MAG TPA: L,D-transpeptidase [Acidimicrobiales bacterium]|nr:L,D-transpeptidase [Acidimicrobiales bacterium]